MIKKRIILVSLIILTFVVIWFLVSLDSQNHSEENNTDLLTAREIKSCIIQYMIDSRDVNLKFGETNESCSVEKIINSLKSKITVNGNTYGPYLNDKLSSYEPMSGTYNGWNIIIKPNKYEVFIIPSQKGNSITFEYD